MARSIAIRTHFLLFILSARKWQRLSEASELRICCSKWSCATTSLNFFTKCRAEFLPARGDNQTQAASRSSQCLIYVHLNSISLKSQSSMVGFSITQELVLLIPDVLLDLLPVTGLPLLTQGPNNTSNLITWQICVWKMFTITLIPCFLLWLS